MFHTPTARHAGLIVKELEDETLVYDLERDEAHCLNQTAALIWKQCDGRSSIDEIATRIGNELNEAVDPNVVWLALAQLRRRRLLAKRLPRPAHRLPTGASGARLSRRELALKLGKVMVIALPVITTIASPRAASAGGSCDPNCGVPPTAICCPTGCPCLTGAPCCSGQCSAGSCT